MKFAAFFRNVNLGQAKSPTKIQLESAMVHAGAESAHSFQSNGTAVFTAASEATAGKIVRSACQILARECGLAQPAYICDLQHLADLVVANPFTGIDPEGVYGYYASFMPPEAFSRLRAPLRSIDRKVEILHVTGKTVLSFSRKLGASPGDPTPFLEKLLQVPVTSRSWNTIVRLVTKFA